MNGLAGAVLAQDTEIREMLPNEREAWDAFVLSSPHGTFFHLSAWKTVIEEALGRRCHYLLARSGGRIRGVYPLSSARSLLFGNCLVSLPLAVYGGVCAEDEETYQALLSAGAKLGASLNAAYVEMRNAAEPFPSDLPSRDLYVTFTQELAPGPDALMKRLPRDTRYAIRKSLKAGLDWTEDVALMDFYDVLAQSFRDLGTPVFPKNLFRVIQREFPRDCRVFGVRKDGELIASVLCFYFKDQVLPYYAGARPEHFRHAPNNFMYWNLICQSHREGLRTFDFGRSKQGTGAFHFKSSWAMEVRPLPYRYQLITAKEAPQVSPVDGKFKLAVSVWKRLPLKVATALGPSVIRRIPSV